MKQKDEKYALRPFQRGSRLLLLPDIMALPDYVQETACAAE